MTVFEIDTGFATDDPLRHVPDWFRDQINSTDVVTVERAYGQHLIGALQEPRTNIGWQRRPKMIATARKHLLADWWFLHALASHSPYILDEILAAYAERVAAG